MRYKTTTQKKHAFSSRALAVDCWILFINRTGMITMDRRALFANVGLPGAAALTGDVSGAASGDDKPTKK